MNRNKYFSSSIYKWHIFYTYNKATFSDVLICIFIKHLQWYIQIKIEIF